MKKISYIFILIFFVLKISSQNVITEIEYLKVINKQDKGLIENNIRNAEIWSNKLVQYPDSFKNIGSLFFKELAKSYYLTGNLEFALLSYYRQRCFFPVTNDAESNKYFFNIIEQIKKGDYILFENIYNQTSKNNNPTSYKKRFELFLKVTYQSGFRNSNEFENVYTDLYRKSFKADNIPYWVKQHNFYTKIAIKPKVRKNLYSFTKGTNDLFIPKHLTKKQKHKICNKAVKYYLHIKNKEGVNKYVNFCKENNIKYCLRSKFISMFL